MKKNTMLFAMIESKTGKVVKHIRSCGVDVHTSNITHINVWYYDHKKNDLLVCETIDLDNEHWFEVL